MTDLEHRPDWSEVLRLAHEQPLAALADRFGTSPAAIAAAWVRTGPHPLALDETEELPPEPGDAEPPHAAPVVEERAVPAPRPRGATSGGHPALSAWRVRWRVGAAEEGAVVLATSLDEAVARVLPLGEVVEVSRVMGRVESV